MEHKSYFTYREGMLSVVTYIIIMTSQKDELQQSPSRLGAIME